MQPFPELPAGIRHPCEAILGGPIRPAPVMNGRHHLLRLYGTRRTGMLKIHRFGQELWERERWAHRVLGVNVPVAQILTSAFLDGKGYILMAHVDGVVLSQVTSPDAKMRAFAAAARNLSQVHQTGYQVANTEDTLPVDELVDLGLGAPDFMAQFAAETSSLGKDYGVRWHADLLRAAEHGIELLRPALQAVGPIHGDYQVKNLLCDQAGHLVAILDWELARRGPAVCDLAALSRRADSLELSYAVFEAYEGAPLGSDPLLAMRAYDLVRVSIGLSRASPRTEDFILWKAFVDGCIRAVLTGDCTLAWRSAARLP